MNHAHPYSAEELRHLRRLIIASGATVEEWTARLRRTADYLLSLSPGQAQIVAQQAQAIAADPQDYGSAEELLQVRAESALVPGRGRLMSGAGQGVGGGRRHYPGPPDDGL